MILQLDQFQPGETWIFFKLNIQPIITKEDGNFNVFCLMEANSQFILATEFISTDLDELSQIDVKRIFKNALSHNQQLPEKLLISDEVKEEQLVSDIKKRNIELISTSEEALAIFINEARNGFQQHVNTGMGQ